MTPVWADRKDASGYELAMGKAETAKRDTVFVLRWINGITTKYRLVNDGDTYDITGIERIDRKKWLVISCSRVGGNL